jgi:UDP-3-O-acyl N-acetylglucosamine deacetylase
MATIRRPERTLARAAVVRGVSFLSGLDVTIRFRPAPAGSGVVFLRSDLPGCPEVPALVPHVVKRARRTALERGEARVEMIEHIMAALAGLRIDNCRIDIDGPETPGCDGSSLAYVAALAEAGVVEQDRPREVLVIDRSITVRDGDAWLAARPVPPDVLPGLNLTYHLDYGADSPIGRQSFSVDVTPESFRAELAPSRTFLLVAEADALRAAGIGRRTSEADLLIFGPHGPIHNVLRYQDECVRHKILDIVGDLALAGRDLVGQVEGHRSGHQLNAALVRALLSDGPVAPDRPSAIPSPHVRVGPPARAAEVASKA